MAECDRPHLALNGHYTAIIQPLYSHLQPLYSHLLQLMGVIRPLKAMTGHHLGVGMPKEDDQLIAGFCRVYENVT